MKSTLKIILTVFIFVSFPIFLSAQKVGFIASDIIRENFSEAKQASQRIQSIVEEWKRELASLDKQIENLEFEIKKNRLVWSDEERIQNEKKLEDLKTQRYSYAKTKFEENGEYDQVVQTMMQPIEDKIFAAIQQVSADEGLDFIFDKSVQPIPYANYKYDMTVKVLRKLGVNVDQLEKELKEKIDADPRNQKVKSKEPPQKVSRERSKKPRDITPQPNEEENPDVKEIPREENPPKEGNPPKEENPVK